MTKQIPLATALLAALASSAASAHPELRSADPPAGTSSASPTRIRIVFNERIIPQFSGIEIKDAVGMPVATERAMTDPGDKKIMIVPLKEPLAPGDYVVEWHAVSDDTHRVRGTYAFGVKRP